MNSCDWPGCGKTFSRPAKLIEHGRSHTQERLFACVHCQKSFLRRSHLQRHQLMTHDGIRPFACEKCDCTFALRHHLNRHQKIHESDRPFRCAWPDCTGAFTKHDQLRQHTCREHTHEPVYPCDTCGQGFDSRTELRKHKEKSHTGRSYVCGHDGCLEVFDKWSALVLHRRTLHRVQPAHGSFTCALCQKEGFSSAASLKQHISKHCPQNDARDEDILPKHPCPVVGCNRTLSSRSNLKTHIHAVHGLERPYKCGQCGQAYGYKRLLLKHQKKHQADTVVPPPAHPPCPLIDVIAGNAAVQDRPIACPMCFRRFKRQFDLDRHLQCKHQNLDDIRNTDEL